MTVTRQEILSALLCYLFLAVALGYIFVWRPVQRLVEVSYESDS